MAAIPCWCGEYAFPHRLFGGRCNAGPNEEPVPYSERGWRVEDAQPDERTEIDNRLDDPRRGQAQWINQGRYYS